MAVAIAVSTDGKYKTFSSENATLATVLSEVHNALEDHNISFAKICFNLTYDAGNSKYAYVATCRL